jgi:hypothetical protein
VKRRIERTLGYVAIAAALSAVVVLPAYAQRRAVVRPVGPVGRVHRGSFVFVGGYFYDPFFGPYPWWGPGAYPYPYYPIYDTSADVRVEVKPKEAGVYVDGYYAGVVDDFDGFFQRLTVPPGEHDLTVYLEGYRTVHQHLYLSSHSTYKVQYDMEHLAAGETSEKPTLAPPVPAPPDGSYMPPRTPSRGPIPPGPPPPPVGGRGVPPGPPPDVRASMDAGTLVLQVQPGGADVTIDGEQWSASENTRLVVQVSAGRHRVEIRKSGYRAFSTEVEVRGGATTPLNVSLSPE